MFCPSWSFLLLQSFSLVCHFKCFSYFYPVFIEPTQSSCLLCHIFLRFTFKTCTCTVLYRKSGTTTQHVMKKWTALLPSVNLKCHKLESTVNATLQLFSYTVMNLWAIWIIIFRWGLGVNHYVSGITTKTTFVTTFNFKIRYWRGKNFTPITVHCANVKMHCTDISEHCSQRYPSYATVFWGFCAFITSL